MTTDPNQVRINDLARELEVRARAIILLLPGYGVTEKKTHSSSIPVGVAEKVRRHLKGISDAESAAKAAAKAEKDAIDAAAKAARLKPTAVAPQPVPGQLVAASAPPASALRAVLRKLFELPLSPVKQKKPAIDSQSYEVSKQKRTMWDSNIENRGFRKFLEDYTPEPEYPHFLDMSPDQQRTVEKWYREKFGPDAETETLIFSGQDAHEASEVTERTPHKAPRTQNATIKQDEATQGSRTSVSADVPPKRITELRKDYLNYFPRLTFLEEALIRLCELEKIDRRRLESNFRTMNEGQTDGKHPVPGTKVWQQDVGKMRVYFGRDGNQNKVVIHLVGRKTWQDSDYQRLRKAAVR